MFCMQMTLINLEFQKPVLWWTGNPEIFPKQDGWHLTTFESNLKGGLGECKQLELT